MIGCNQFCWCASIRKLDDKSICQNINLNLGKQTLVKKFFYCDSIYYLLYKMLEFVYTTASNERALTTKKHIKASKCFGHTSKCQKKKDSSHTPFDLDTEGQKHEKRIVSGYKNALKRQQSNCCTFKIEALEQDFCFHCEKLWKSLLVRKFR